VAIDVALGLSLLALAELVSGYLIWLGQFLVFDPLRFCTHFVSFLVFDPLRCCADLKPALAVRRLADAQHVEPLRMCIGLSASVPAVGAVSFLVPATLALVYGCVLWLWQFLVFFAADPLRFWGGLGAALGVRRLAEAHPKRLRVLLLPLPLSVPLLPHSAPQTERLLVEAPMVALTISPRSVSFQYRAGQLGGSGRIVAVFRCT
jgi:hypothetical protein